MSPLTKPKTRPRKKKPTYPKVTIEWDDAEGGIARGGWIDVAELRKGKPPRLHSTGYLIHEDETQYIIATDVDPKDPSQVASANRIPRGCVISIVKEK